MESKILEELRPNSLLWFMTFDMTDQKLYVQFEDGEPTDEFTSEDGNYTAYVRYERDGIPVLVALSFAEVMRIGVIEEWIAEAAELALDYFGDDFAKGLFQVIETSQGKEVVSTNDEE